MNVSCRPPNNGFTLMELLVVLAIAALLAGLARPMYSAVVPGARLEAQARDLVVLLRDTANRAVSGGREITMRFSPEASSYVVSGERPVVLPAGTQLHFVEPSAQDEHLLRFFADGSSSGASMVLRNESRAYHVTVDWLTGRVRVMEANNEAM